MNFYCFDFHGAYLGHIDSEGVVFDSRGTSWARVGAGGNVYDLEGRRLGRIDAQGSIFAGDGSCRGYVRDWVPREFRPAAAALSSQHSALNS